jgi:reactive intermediate/imine deaminase
MKQAIVLLTTAGLALSGAAVAGELQVEYYGLDPALQLPFSEAVRVGDMLYLSGAVGNLPGTSQLAAGGIQGETRQAMENIKASLEKHGSSLDEVVKCTVFLADVAEWGAMNEVYVTYFREAGAQPGRQWPGAGSAGRDRVPGGPALRAGNEL